MQRQSLGSPVSKLHSHGGGSSKDADTPITDIDSKRIEDDDEELKTTKLHRQSLSFTLSPPPKPEKFVHVIPILTLLCFLILYLCSHSPSQSGNNTLLPSHRRPPLLSSNYLYLILTVLFLFVSDLAQFNGFKRPAQHIGIMQILLEFLYFSVFVLCICLLFFWLISSCRFRQDWRCRAIYWAPKKRCFGDPKPPELARAAKKTTLPQISPTPKTRRFLSRIFRLIHRFPHVRISQWNHTCSCFPYLFIFPYKSFFYFWLPDV